MNCVAMKNYEAAAKNLHELCDGQREMNRIAAHQRLTEFRDATIGGQGKKGKGNEMSPVEAAKAFLEERYPTGTVRFDLPKK